MRSFKPFSDMSNREQTPGVIASYDAATDGEMRMIGTTIEGWEGSPPTLAAPRIQALPRDKGNHCVNPKQ
jgi:hypothetical protein